MSDLFSRRSGVRDVTRMIRRLVAGVVAGVALSMTGGPASAQTVTVEFGPIEIIQRVGQVHVEIGPGEIIQEGTRYTIIEGVEMVFDISMPVLEGEIFLGTPPIPVLEGEELIFYLPRQSFTYDGGTDGGSGGGGGGGPDCGPTGCGG